MLFDQKPVRTVAPTVSPVTVADLKAHCGVEHDDDDVFMNLFLEAAVDRLDGRFGLLNQAMITQTWQSYAAAFPCGPILRLPLGPVQSAAVTYLDADGVSQTLAPANYHVLADHFGPLVHLADGAAWPATKRHPKAVTVTAVVGFGATPGAVPAALRLCVLVLAADLYRHRESVIAGVPVAEIPTSMRVRDMIAARAQVGIS